MSPTDIYQKNFIKDTFTIREKFEKIGIQIEFVAHHDEKGSTVQLLFPTIDDMYKLTIMLYKNAPEVLDKCDVVIKKHSFIHQSNKSDDVFISVSINNWSKVSNGLINFAV